MYAAARRLLATMLLAVLAGCAQLTTEPETPQEPVETAAARPLPEKITAEELPPEPPVDLWERVRRQLSMHTLHNDRIGAARDYYLRQPRYFTLIAPRANRYLYYLVEEVERRELPIELALLPLVESAMNPFAFSGVQAAGMWQIMPGTADDLGIRRDWWYDGRLDVRESTNRALDHLEGLVADFDGDWLLALAAYNSGKGRVRQSLARNRRNGTGTDFWSLELPWETRHYVPRLIALSTLIAFDEALELELPPIPNEPAFTAVQTGGQIEMLRVAELAGLELMELRRFNPGQLRWASAPGGNDELLVPRSVAVDLLERLQELPADERVTWQSYRIRRGDSLISIARRFDTQVGLLREVNNVQGNLIRAGDIMMIPDSTAWRESMALAERGRSGVRRGYKVRRGDSLYRIANRFNVTIDEIISWNNLDPARYLQPGQSLTLYISGG